MAFKNLQYDVVLLYPPAEVILEEYDEPDFPAIGIAYVGNYLEHAAGISPALIDAKLNRFSVDETVRQIVDLQPKVLGISAMTHMIIIASKVAERVKEELPEIVIILGGFHASFLPERTLREFPIYDFLVMGEGEIAFMKLVQSILNGSPNGDIKGIAFQKNSQIINNGRGEIPETLDELGEPGWHLFDQDILFKYLRALPVMGQRGCPFGCNFCSRPYGRIVRKRTPSKIVDEIEKNVHRYPVEQVRFEDETFTVDRKFTYNLCQELIARRSSFYIDWICHVHANCISLELAKAMRLAGCKKVGYGVESGDDRIIKGMKKGVTKQRTLEARSILHEAGIETTAYFIIGHPHETTGSIWNTIKFAVKLNADTTAIGILVPYPGTETWELAIKGEGGYKKLSDTWSDYNKQLGNAVELEHISRRQIELFQVLGYVSIYLFNLRLKDLLKEVMQHRKLVKAMLGKLLLNVQQRAA